jgi:hypothetical protein
VGYLCQQFLGRWSGFPCEERTPSDTQPIFSGANLAVCLFPSAVKFVIPVWHGHGSDVNRMCVDGFEVLTAALP